MPTVFVLPQALAVVSRKQGQRFIGQPQPVQMIEHLAQLVVCKLDFTQIGRFVLSEPVRAGTLDHHLRPIKVFPKVVGLVRVKEMNPQEKGAL